VTICLVTDRRRLAPDASFAVARRTLADQARAAAAAGVDLFQIREPGLEAAQLAAIVEDARAVTRGTRTRVVVNDRLDIAMACGADGVHLRADSITVAAARRLAPDGFTIGRSVHSAADVASAAGADYLIAGTVFPSASKDASRPLLGVEGLRAIAAATAIPVLAIGGIDEDRLDDVAGAGAEGIAAIGWLAAVDAAALRILVERARLRFDRVRRGP
jgi:thiamine-phosphate pyrophosphorylase